MGRGDTPRIQRVDSSRLVVMYPFADCLSWRIRMQENLSWDLDVSFDYNGSVVRADQYGTSYLTEFLNIIFFFSPRRSAPINVLEWGAGLTTLAMIKNSFALNINSILSLDNNIHYATALQSNISQNWCSVKHWDITGFCRNQDDPELNYATAPFLARKDFDFIFIDGRRRMECAMMALLLGTGDHTVVIHDHRRARYQPVSAFYDVLSDRGQFKIMRPKSAVYNALNKDFIRSLISFNDD